jgi:hypothetical protein
LFKPNLFWFGFIFCFFTLRLSKNEFYLLNFFIKGGENMREKYITATEAARKYGLTNSYVAKLAKRAKQQGEPLLKKEKAWLAPSEVWDKIINNPSMIPRKKRKNDPTEKAISKTLDIKEQEELLSAAKAAKKYGISSNWAAKLARRSKEIGGFEWPQKVGTVWMAPYGEWVKIFKSKKLKKWTKKR